MLSIKDKANIILELGEQFELSGALLQTVHAVFGAIRNHFKELGENAFLPTLKDWEIHLSTVFPDIRLKKYIEMRGSDRGSILCGSFNDILGRTFV